VTKVTWLAIGIALRSFASDKCQADLPRMSAFGGEGHGACITKCLLMTQAELRYPMR
jgi:hypothetical protein